MMKSLMSRSLIRLPLTINGSPKIEASSLGAAGATKRLDSIADGDATGAGGDENVGATSPNDNKREFIIGNLDATPARGARSNMKEENRLGSRGGGLILGALGYGHVALSVNFFFEGGADAFAPPL